MPRGRPRKSHVEASPSSSGFAGASDDATSASASRPSRNRIAVRRFGAASDQDYQQSLGDAPAPSPSSSPGKQHTPLSNQAGGGYILVHKSFWNDVCTKLGCSSCGKRSVQMKTEKLSGLASKLIMYCTACGVVLSQVTSSPETEHDPEPEEELDFEVNRRFVKFFVSEGKTYNDVVVFSKTLGIPIISKSMFEKYRDEIIAAGN